MVNGTRDFSNTATSSYSQEISVQTTDAEDVDQPGDQNFWQTNTWTTHNSYYKNHNSVKTIINKLGMWTIGKGYTEETDPKVIKTLEKIKGDGKSSFNEEINNCVRGRHIDGDSYAQIVRDKAGKLINLRSLNAGRVKVYYSNMGMIRKYGYTNSDGTETAFAVNEIFHLRLNQIGNEIHGTGDIETIISFLDKIKQLDEDMAVMFHAYVVPRIMWHLNTDKSTEINKFKADAKTSRDGGQDIFIPQKAVEWELIEAKQIVDPLTWRQTWVEEVTKGGGVPALIMAIEAGTTEASSKMVYLAWQQVIEAEQLYLEAQIKLQLRLDVKFEFPASIEENLDDDQKKDGSIKGEKKSEIIPTKPEVKK